MHGDVSECFELVLSRLTSLTFQRMQHFKENQQLLVIHFEIFFPSIKPPDKCLVLN